MRIPRIYIDAPLQTGVELQLPAQAGEHLARVLRLTVGAPLLLFNGDGCEYPAILQRIGKREVWARVDGEGVAQQRESALQLTLAQGIARGDKMDFILQKATELGVQRIVPLLTERTEVKLNAERSERRMAHWRAVISSACEQSGRTRLPELSEPMTLTSWAAALDDSSGVRLSLDPRASATPRSLATLGAATLVIGPEGGLSAKDLMVVEVAGFRGMRLGPRILRTETAGLAAIAALQAVHGDF